MFKALEDDLLAAGVEVVLGAWRTLLKMALNVLRGKMLARSAGQILPICGARRLVLLKRSTS